MIPGNTIGFMVLLRPDETTAAHPATEENPVACSAQTTKGDRFRRDWVVHPERTGESKLAENGCSSNASRRRFESKIGAEKPARRWLYPPKFACQAFADFRSPPPQPLSRSPAYTIRQSCRFLTRLRLLAT